MTCDSSIGMHRLRALFSGALAAAALGLLAGCGGGGGGDPAPAAPVAIPAGPPVTVTVGAAGGALVFTASGVAGRLSFPAGALADDTAITVTPVEPADGEWARLDVAGVGDVLDQPATLTLTLPAGSTLHPEAAVTQAASEGDVLLPGALDTGMREITVTVQQFGRGGVATAQTVGRRAAPPGNPGTLILNQRLLVKLRVITAEARLRELQRIGDFSSTLALSTSIAALLQSSGLDGWEADALPWLNRAGASACEELRLAIARTLSTPAPTDLDLEGRVGNAFVTRVSAPVLYWSGVVDRLGVGCPGLDPQAAIGQAHQRLVSVVADKLRARQDVATLRGAVGEAAAAKALHRQGQVLSAVGPAAPRTSDRARALRATAAADGDGDGVSRRSSASTSPATLGAQVRDQVMVPTFEPLRGAHWQAGNADATQDHYRYVLAVYGAASPLADDLQMVRTSLEVTSTAGNESLGTARGGGGATPHETVGEVTVPARKGGRIDLGGSIDVLRCPNAANERLVIDVDGATVLDRASAGGKLLETAQQLGVDALLAAANIDTATEGTHTLHVRRVGSSCNATFGLADAVLMRVRLDFRAGKPPAPSLIAGKRFSGTLVFYYAPDRHPDCSRSCLANNPGETRCRSTEESDVEVAVTGTAAEYTMTIRARPRLGPEFSPTWQERVFKGPGTAASAGGNQVGGIGVVDASRQQAGLSLNPATGDVAGAIYGKCSEEEFRAR